MLVATTTSFCCSSWRALTCQCRTGHCSFRFTNEKLGDEGRNLLRDVFNNLPYQPGQEMQCPPRIQWDLVWGRR